MGPPWWKMPMMQARRGDLRAILLNVLKDKPMHGYEIIRHLEQQSHGMWRPSPGSVYPTLQMLEEEELVVSREENGKKVYDLTEKGKTEADRLGEQAPWHRNKTDFEAKKALRYSFFELAHAFRQIARSSDEAKATQAIAILQEASAKLSALLNSDTVKGGKDE